MAKFCLEAQIVPNLRSRDQFSMQPRSKAAGSFIPGNSSSVLLPSSERRWASTNVPAIFPATPSDDAQVRFWGIRQHGEEFQQVTVRIVEVEGSSRHPG